MNARESPRPARVGALGLGHRASRPGPAGDVGWSPSHKLAEREVKNTAGVVSGDKKNNAGGSVRQTLSCFVPEVNITAGRLGGGEKGPNLFLAIPGPRTGSVRKSPKNTARWEGPESPLGWAESKKNTAQALPQNPRWPRGWGAPVQKTLLGLSEGRNGP